MISESSEDKAHISPEWVRERIAAVKSDLFVASIKRVVHTKISGEPIVFNIEHPRDFIQKQHQQGRFFGVEGLELIKKHFKAGDVFVDIGSNIGNHSLYVAKFLKPERIIPFEPLPRAIECFLANMRANNVLDVFDLSCFGVGLGDQYIEGLSTIERPRNMGATRLDDTGEGDLKVIPGDEVLKNREQLDFVKIDVETMEMKVLAGLAQTIKRHRPKIHIEVDRENKDAFSNWMDENAYKCFEETPYFWRDRAKQLDVLIGPIEKT